MNPPRFFVHFAASSPEEAIDRLEAQHGAVSDVRMYAPPGGSHVYGSAEVEPLKLPPV
jgi:hypothetical protein